MPEDPNIYLDFIKNRMTPEQAKTLAEDMDQRSANRGWFAVFAFLGLIALMIALSCL